jgi:hypothetical protein
MHVHFFPERVFQAIWSFFETQGNHPSGLRGNGIHGKVLVCHPGSGPNFIKKDGAKDLLSVLNQFPKLKVIVAHCGACEYGDYQALAG